MNKDRLQQIFSRYIEKFDILNGDVHKEYFKWQIAKRFRPMMDEALAAPADELPTKLAKLPPITSFLIDNSRIYPFGGLVQCSKREPETVRMMFSDLYSGEEPLQDRISTFLTRSHAMRDRYFPGSYKYTNDVHSVTAYLAMYDPDHHYIFKASHARKFADCVEFYDDWGSGDTVKIDVFYRMCDQLVEAIKGSEELLAADARRFTGELGVDSGALHSDQQKHILAFDLIYCCSTYNLFDGIAFPKRTAKERRAIREAEQQCEELTSGLDGIGNQLNTFIEEYEDNTELLTASKMETLTESLKATGQAISDLLAVIEKANSHNIQQDFTPPPNLALLTKRTIQGAKRTHRRFCRAFFFVLQHTTSVIAVSMADFWRVTQRHQTGGRSTAGWRLSDPCISC